MLHYRLAGDHGPYVVFVHGSLGDLDDWRAQLDLFSRDNRVLVYSRRYHPPNAPTDDRGAYTPAVHAEDLATLLRALGVGPAHVIGSDYGGYVALALATEHPDLVRTLVLEEPSVIPFLGRTPWGDSLRRTYEERVLDPSRAALSRRDSVLGVRLFFDGANGRPGSFDQLSAAARERTVGHSAELRRELLAERRDYMPALDCASLGRRVMPVLLLQGEQSPRMYRVITTELARCLQSDTVISVPNAGHSIHTTNAALFNQTVLRFLTAH
jgi:non-heme chloroperoxidase